MVKVNSIRAFLTMVPVSARRVHDERVSERAARGYRALRHSRRAVHRTGTELSEAVKVERRRLIAQLVVEEDGDPFTNIGLDFRQRPLAIDADNRAVESIWSGMHPLNVPPVRLVSESY